MLLLSAKNIAIFLGLATVAFGVSTIVLAVQKSELEDDLQDARNKLDILNGLTTTQSPNTSSTHDPNTSASTGNDTTSNPITQSSTPISSTFPTPPIETTQSTSTSTTIEPILPTQTSTINPNYPSLPTDLPDPSEIVWRLPEHLRAIKYRIHFYPDLVQRTCSGTVSIQFQAFNVTNLIVLHAKDLEIEAISILNMSVRMRIAIEKYYVDDKRELLIIELKELLNLSRAYTLSISYNCGLDGLSGAYISSYTDANGNEK